MVIDITIVLPSYNEEDRIRPALEDLGRHLEDAPYTAEILVVDDGSTDRTADLVRSIMQTRPRIRLIESHRNLGKGHALWLAANATRAPFLAIMDADMATPPEFIDRLLERLRAGDQVVVGSRVLPGSCIEVQQPLHRQLMGRIYRTLVQGLISVGFSDPQCGFKGFHTATLLKLLRRQTRNRFGFDIELLAIAEANRLRMSEIPVYWRHRSGSKVRLLVDPLRMLKDLAVVRGNIERGYYRLS